jgi:tRNA nucleotidyltransferase/poly(A) polymerase
MVFWDSVVSKPWYSTTSKNKTKSAKEAKKNNSIPLKAIHNGLSEQVKENMGYCTFSKVLCLQLSNYYQNIEQNKETKKSNHIKEQDKKKENSNQIEEKNTNKENSNQNKEQNTEEDNSIKELMQTLVINNEEYYIKELANTSVFTK